MFFMQRNAVLVLLFLLILIVVFLFLVNVHNTVKEKARVVGNLVNINQRELQLLQFDTNGIDGGSDFADPKHHYTSDLDIFGSSSLFSHLNRTSCESGRQELSRWLLKPAALDTIKSRQEAVQETAAEHEKRQHFEALRSESKNEGSDIVSWLKMPIDKLPGWLLIFKYLVPILTILALITVFGYSGSYYLVAIPYLLGLLSLRVTQKQIETVHADTKLHATTLSSISKLLRAIELRSFRSSYLIHQRNKLAETKSSTEIKKIHKVLDAFNGRANIFYHLFNSFLLLDVYILGTFRQWQIRNGANIEGWFDALGKVDAVYSLAGFSFAHPESTMPVFEESRETHLEVREIHHPLISQSVRVGNSFSMNDPEHLALVTGSNMSGKSTFLRTLGINIVLAYTGCCVLAESMKLGRYQIFTSMRIVDDLNQNMSSFYAELARIKQLIDILEEELPVFYLLDEILLGTNSNDRHKGSVALIKQLLKSNCMGLIATHDLKLGELAEEDDRIVNYCFTSEVRDDQLHFDYKIRPGIGYNFNATELMKKMGLDIKNP